MDCARFIRKPGVFIMWLITPLLLVALTTLGPQGFRTQSQVKLLQLSALEEFIPVMQLESSRFEQFLKDYSGNGSSTLLIEDAYMARVNESADPASFTVSSIRLTKDPVNPKTNTHRLNILIEGSGSAQSIASFLSNIKSRDRFLYEDTVLVNRAAREKNNFTAKIGLSKIYVEQKEPSP